GICVNVAIFAFVDAALLQPLPYQNPGRLVGVYETVAVIAHSNISYLDYEDWKKLSDVFQSFDVYGGGGHLMNTPSGVVPVTGSRVSSGFFKTLGVAPLMGRDFRPEDDIPGAPATVM